MSSEKKESKAAFFSVGCLLVSLILSGITATFLPLDFAQLLMFISVAAFFPLMTLTFVEFVTLGLTKALGVLFSLYVSVCFVLASSVFRIGMLIQM